MKFCPICLWQNAVRCQKVLGWKLFHAVSTNRKPRVDGRLLLRFHDAVPIVRGQHAPQTRALAVASVHALRAVAHSLVSSAHLFCIVFGQKFNIMSAPFVHQPLTLPQKIDSREGLL